MKNPFFYFCLYVFLTVFSEIIKANESAVLTMQEWSFNGPYGTFDRAQLQRGFQVYKEVCAACHSLELLSYRNLEALGFSKDEVKEIAREYQVKDGPNDQGEMFERSALPSDRFAKPYANKEAARATNNGAYPPDLSLITKARPGGADYVYALLTGFKTPPIGMQLNEGLHYNNIFLGNQIAMAPPLSEGIVNYSDGKKASVSQMALDVSVFLSWASEPELEKRKQMGVMVIFYLLAFTIFVFLAMKRIWSRVK
jgi:ubiquinol-cytochrome c reductase cytochrome c1 subunit